MKALLRTLPRLAAALAFTATATAAVVLGGAANAGSTPSTPFNAAPQAADAAVFVRAGIGNYPRWRWDGYHRTWIRYGFAYGSPGFVANVGYVGYAAPAGPPYWVAPAPYPHYWGGYYHPVYRGWYGGYYHPFFHGYRR